MPSFLTIRTKILQNSLKNIGDTVFDLVTFQTILKKHSDICYPALITERHLCWSFLFIKLQAGIIESLL